MQQIKNDNKCKRMEGWWSENKEMILLVCLHAPSSLKWFNEKRVKLVCIERGYLLKLCMWETLILSLLIIVFLFIV